MKVHVNPDGSVELDVANGDGQAAVDLIHALQADATRKQKSVERSETMRQANVKVEGSGGLNQIQYRTWEYLCENDSNSGIHVSQVARAFAITNAAANSRLITLHTLGYAKRVHKGYYRALTPENG